MACKGTRYIKNFICTYNTVMVLYARSYFSLKIHRIEDDVHCNKSLGMKQQCIHSYYSSVHWNYIRYYSGINFCCTCKLVCKQQEQLCRQKRFYRRCCIMLYVHILQIHAHCDVHIHKKGSNMSTMHPCIIN